jgi:hypothetical protein
MSPLEHNGRALIGVLAKYFPAEGATSEDLRRQFEKKTHLARQAFYDALKYVKAQGWIVGVKANRLEQRGQSYTLNPDGSWKEPPISVGEQLEIEQRNNDRLEYVVGSQTQHIEELQNEIECLRDFSGGGSNGVAISNLAKIIGDNTASVRQRVKAAGALLAYKVDDDSIVGFARGYLESVCASADNFDYRIEAGELLRRHEAPRVAPETVRPVYPTDADPTARKSLAEVIEARRARVGMDLGAERSDLAELVARRRARAAQMEREDIEAGRRDPVTGRWHDKGPFTYRCLSDSGSEE